MKLEEEKYYKDDGKKLCHSSCYSDKELKCHPCDGSGHVSHSSCYLDKELKCHLCDGSDHVSHSSCYLDKELKCHLCDGSGHVSTLNFRGKKVIEYYTCEKFASMTHKQRFELLKEKGLCRQCLNPGVKESIVTHKECKCYSRFTYKNKHDGSRKWHVLACDRHRYEKNNLALLEEYKGMNMGKNKLVLPEHSKNIRICFHNLNVKITKKSLFHSKNKHEDSLFLLQTIKIDSEKFNLFYGTGCQDSASKKEAIDKLELLRRASSQLPGPITSFGVGNQKSISKHGIYSVKLPLFDGGNAMISGICLDRITTEFPIYSLKGDVEEDIHKSYRLKGLNVEDLPNLPLQRHFKEQAMLVKLGYRVNLDLPLLSIKNKGDPHYEIVNEMVKRASYQNKRILKAVAHFHQVESAGTEVSYRCTSVNVVKIQNLSAYKKKLSRISLIKVCRLMLVKVLQ